MSKIIFPDYSNSIVNMMASFRKYYGLDFHHSTLKSLDNILKKKYKNVVLVLLDGMGSKIIENAIGNDNFLLRHKICDYLSVYPCTTAAATTSVLTTITPLESSWIGWHQYFKQVDHDIVMFMNTGYYDDKKFDYNVVNTYVPYKTILDELEEIGIKTRNVMPSFKEGGAKTFDEFLEQINNFINQNDGRKFAYAYWDEPDHTLHNYGCNSKQAKQLILELNIKLEEFSKKIDDDTLVIVTADHGHYDVLEINLYGYPKILSMLERLPSIEPRCATFFVKKEKVAEFQVEFNSLWKDDFILLTKEEALKKNIFGTGNKHHLFDNFLGDYIALATGRYMFGYNENLDDENTMLATHAGLTEDEMIIPLIKF